MATSDDVKAAFEAYHQAVSERIAALEAAQAAVPAPAEPVDLQPLVDEITAAQSELAPAAVDTAPADATATDATAADATATEEAPAAPAVDNSVKWND